MKYCRDYHNALDTARDEAEIKGKSIRNVEIAKVLIAMGDTDEKIAQATGLSIDEVTELRKPSTN